MCSYNSGGVVNHIHLPAARRIPLAVTKTAGLDRVACGRTREEGRHCRDKGDFIIAVLPESSNGRRASIRIYSPFVTVAAGARFASHRPCRLGIIRV